MDRLWVKLIVYPAVGLMAFFFLLWAMFPTGEIEKIAKQRIENALGGKYTVEFGSFGLSGLSGISAEEVSINSVPPPLNLSDEERKKFKRINMTIDKVDLGVSLLDTLTGAPGGDFEVGLGGGTLEGSASQVSYDAPKPKKRRGRSTGRTIGKKKGKDLEAEAEKKAEEGEGNQRKGVQVDAEIVDIPLTAIKILQATLGVPLNGNVGGTISTLVGQGGGLVKLDTNLKIGRVSLGPGTLPFDTGFGNFELPNAIRVGDLIVKTHTDKEGKIIIDELRTTGPDLVLEANGNIKPSPNFARSRAQINARIKPSNDFLVKNNLKGILDLSPKVRNAKSGEWYGVLLSGPLDKLSPHPSARTASGLKKASP